MPPNSPERAWLLKLALVAALPLVLVLAIYTGFKLAYSGCDIHDTRIRTSPDGRWQALWQLQGCHGKFDSMVFRGTVTIGPGSSPAVGAAHTAEAEVTATGVPAVFEDDSPDPPRLTWTGPATLNIEVPTLATITTSQSTHGEVAVTYSVPALLRHDLVDSPPGEGAAPLGSVPDNALHQQVLGFRQWVLAHVPAPAGGRPDGATHR